MKFMEKKIGELNGIWALMLRLTLVLVPFWIGWSVWVTKSVFTHERLFSEERNVTNERIEVKTDLIRGDIQKLGQEITDLKIAIAKQRP
jgi:hypothetical protein